MTTSYYPAKSPGISEITFVPKVGYQGTASISYTGWDTKGNEYRGRIQISVRPATASRYFWDMSSFEWAVPAVDLLYENGVVHGTGNGTYSPGQQITRGDYVLMRWALQAAIRTEGSIQDHRLPARMLRCS